MDLLQKSGRCLGVVAAIIAVPMAADAAPATSQGLEEIVVTAQKREEKLSETPVSVTALSAKDLEAMAATQFRDFATTVPGLNFTTSGIGETQINLRGITTGGNVSPTVGIYVDEVPYGSSTAFASGAQLGLDVGLFDVQRVEVLRGPQGTLYGASTMGGLLKYVSVTPDLHDFGGTVRAGLSSTEHGGTNYDVASAVNAPITDGKSAVRLSGFYSKDGGYIDDLQLGKDNVNEADVYGGRADFLLQPSDKLSVRLTAFAQDVNRDGSINGDFDATTGKPIDGELDQRNALPQPFDQEFRLVSATVDYDFGPAQLTSITSYQTAQVTNSADLTDLYVPLLGLYGFELSSLAIDKEIETNKFTQELRLAATGPRLDWLVGAFYTNEDSDQRQAIRAYDLSGALSPIDFFKVHLPSSYEEIAGFATLTYHATEKLDLTGGLRYAHNSQEQEQIGSGALGGSAPKRDSSEDVTTYLANLRYLVSDNVMTYLRVATGYRPGGPNVVLNDPDTGQPFADPTFDSDSLTSYEGGIKASTSDQRFSVDAAVYQIDWNDLQMVAVRNGVGVVANASSARSRGLELTLTALPIPELRLTGAFGYINAELSEDSPDLGASKGDSLPDTPEFTAALAADYSFAMAGHDATAGASWRYIDDRVSGYDNDPSGAPQYELPDYAVLDLRGAMVFGATNVQLYVKNVTDERGQLSATTSISLLGGPAQVSMLQPRTYGVAINVGF
ncbi:MAG TPA: TonB-dependent receptor [Steroidobacteraceae bacterium]